MFRSLEEGTESPAFDGDQVIQAGRLRFIRVNDRLRQGEFSCIGRHNPALGATGPIRIRLVRAPIDHDLSAFRAEGHPDIDPVVIPPIDDGLHATDLDPVLPCIEVHEVIGRRAAFGIEAEMLAIDAE